MYCGSFLRDEKHGKGIYKYISGDVYEGMFANDKLHGAGKYICLNGGSFIATWRAGKVHGTVLYSFANGDSLIGEYEDDIPVGEVTVTLKHCETTHIFPWPESEFDFVDGHAHAARDLALALIGLVVLFIVILYFLSHCSDRGRRAAKGNVATCKCVSAPLHIDLLR